MNTITKIYESIGGNFIINEALMQEKLKSIKAFVFDWDGVFNNGEKSGGGSSNFNEVDSMGTNLLRYSFFLKNNQLPTTAIISGEKNESAFWFCNRERFNYSFFKFANKIHALNHICTQQNITPNQVAYFFDDVLDLSIAKLCGLRILINRKNNPSFKNFVVQNNLVDYITAGQSGQFAVREACELLIELNGNYTQTIQSRMDFEENYKLYINLRNQNNTQLFTFLNDKVVKIES